MKKSMSKAEAGRLGGLAFAKNVRQKVDERKSLYYSSPKVCECCGSVLPYEQHKEKRFCSRSCSAFFNNKLRSNTARCLNCDKSLEGKPRRQKCCSRSCSLEYLKRHKNKNIQESPGDFNDRTLKKFLLDINGHQCQICGRKTWCGHPIPIELDHIDGHASNNDLENLRLLCSNCHSLTPTYCGKNKGNGREERRERYRRKNE